ncbi:MAG: zinc-dependent alcohol dehydrogenase family protein [Cyclobacteriaceae bacterium]|nr:zinc-dependent alcohol dehydrogenase family protein [Cyclobacteriaceae bacterium]
MKAIVYEKFNGPLTLQNVPDPSPTKKGVVIELKSSGLCKSDWHGWMGHDKDIELPHVPGHELAGTIIDVGEDIRRFKIGDRVTVPFVSGCGECSECKTDNHQICDYQFQPGFTHWGSFAQYVAIDYADTNLVVLPEEINFVTAASLGCRFATSFRGVIDQGQAKLDDWVVIHGSGGVGLSAIMIANAIGAKVIAVDINEEQLELAKSIGATNTILSSNSRNIIEEIHEITHGGAHVSIDALGNPDVLFNSVSCLKKRGKHIQIGLMSPEDVNAKIPIDQIIAKELEIIGSHGMQAHRYDEMLNMITEGKLHPEKLVAQTICLEDISRELPKMDTSTAVGIKVITDFS